jgi:peptidyl-prolyl cis-trans isomerase B (cyclophilin B)
MASRGVAAATARGAGSARAVGRGAGSARAVGRDARATRGTARAAARRARLENGKTNDDDDDDDDDDATTGRRATLVGACAAAVMTPRARAMDATANVTARVYLDVGACEGAANAARALGDDGGALCATPEPFGRIVVGLYGDAAPDTVRNFLALCSNAASTPTLAGTVFHKIDKGNGYVVGGKSGSPRLGQVSALSGERFSNGDVTRASAFEGRHFRPGTVSLALESAAKDGEYGTTAQFLITTGPAPVPSLDNKNIVFGRVEQGLDVVQRLSNEKTFKPSETARAYNALANLVGDSRAGKAKAAWIKPTRALVITSCGVLDA